MPSSTVSPTPYIDGKMHSFFLAPTSSIECEVIILEVKNTYCGKNSISTSIFRHISEIICAPISNLMNESFRNGVFPISLKVACVIPLYETGDKNLVSNCRPISILPLISKVFEKKNKYKN